jgi:hypothetical protein
VLGAIAVVPIPDAMDFVTAAAFPVAYGTSHLALTHRGDLQSGETLLVLGAAGGVGLTAVEIGKSIGARVITAAGGAENLAVARSRESCRRGGRLAGLSRRRFWGSGAFAFEVERGERGVLVDFAINRHRRHPFIDLVAEAGKRLSSSRTSGREVFAFASPGWGSKWRFSAVSRPFASDKPLKITVIEVDALGRPGEPAPFSDP